MFRRLSVDRKCSASMFVPAQPEGTFSRRSSSTGRSCRATLVPALPEVLDMPSITGSTSAQIDSIREFPWLRRWR